MRKVIVILLAALLLLSFTSCNQDKIEELEAQVKQEKEDHEATIKNFEDFIDTYDILKGFYSTNYNGLLTSSEDTFEVTLDSTNASNIGFKGDFIKHFAVLNEGETFSEENYPTTKNATGAIRVTKEQTESTYYSRTLEFKNTSFDIEYSYIVYDSSNKTTSVKKRDLKGLTISGTLSISENRETSNSATVIFSFDGTINGTKYKLSYSATYNTSDSTYEYTEVKVNGNAVELRIVNKMDIRPMVIGH